MSSAYTIVSFKFFWWNSAHNLPLGSHLVFLTSFMAHGTWYVGIYMPASLMSSALAAYVQVRGYGLNIRMWVCGVQCVDGSKSYLHRF